MVAVPTGRCGGVRLCRLTAAAVTAAAVTAAGAGVDQRTFAVRSGRAVKARKGRPRAARWRAAQHWRRLARVMVMVVASTASIREGVFAAMLIDHAHEHRKVRRKRPQ